MTHSILQRCSSQAHTHTVWIVRFGCYPSQEGDEDGRSSLKSLFSFVHLSPTASFSLPSLAPPMAVCLLAPFLRAKDLLVGLSNVVPAGGGQLYSPCGGPATLAQLRTLWAAPAASTPRRPGAGRDGGSGDEHEGLDRPGGRAKPTPRGGARARSTATTIASAASAVTVDETDLPDFAVADPKEVAQLGREPADFARALSTQLRVDADAWVAVLAALQRLGIPVVGWEYVCALATHGRGDDAPDMFEFRVEIPVLETLVEAEADDEGWEKVDSGVTAGERAR